MGVFVAELPGEDEEVYLWS